MELFERSMVILSDLFGRDFQFSLATVKDSKPSVRVVDTYYENGEFWVVTHAQSNKVKEIEGNANVALYNYLYSFKGNAHNVGHPLKEENKAIRDRLIKIFESWYFAHNNENDKNVCYVKIELTEGFFFKDGKGYRVNFINKTAKEFPFAPDITLIS